MVPCQHHRGDSDFLRNIKNEPKMRPKYFMVGRLRVQDEGNTKHNFHTLCNTLLFDCKRSTRKDHP